MNPTIFEEMVDSSSENLSNIDLVGLAGFYLRRVEECYPFSTGDIRDVIEPSLYHVPSSSIGAYSSQLADKGHFQRRNGNWDLTATGIEYYSEKVDYNGKNPTPRPESDLFVSINPPDDPFYSKFIEDINRSYQHRIYDSTMILSRKLLENLLIELLRTELGAQDGLHAFYIPEEKRFQPFSVLVQNFREYLDQFRPYLRNLDEDFVDVLDSFRVNANANAHSIRISIDESEIEARSEDIDYLSRSLFRLRDQIALASTKSSN